MAEFLTQKIHLKCEGDERKLLFLLAFISKNIYNSALFQIKEWYMKSKGKCLKLETIIERLCKNENYLYLGKDWSDSIISDAHKAVLKYIKFHDFEGKLKEENSKLTDKKDYAKFPKFYPSNGFRSFRGKGILRDETNNYVILPLPEKIKDGSIFKDKIKDKELKEYIEKVGVFEISDIKIKVSKNIMNNVVRIIEIIPEKFGYNLYACLIYPVTPTPVKPKLDNKIMGIDLGVNNLMSCVTTEGYSFIINGRTLKSFICLFNKKIAYYQSKLPIIKEEKGIQKKKTKRLMNLYNNANNKISDYLDKAVALLFKCALKHDIRTIVIGWNTDFKEVVAQNSGDNTVDQQKKLNIIVLGTPLAKLRNKIINKGKRLGISVETVDENNTSKKSFYDNDNFYDKVCSGTRVERGLYVLKNGKTKVNADINAALNILTKYSLKRKRPIEALEKLREEGVLIPTILKVDLD